MEQEQSSPAPEPAVAASASVAGRHALVLSGGGARAAYQVGVLRAVSELLPDPQPQSLPDPVRHLGRFTQCSRARLPGGRFRPWRGQARPGLGQLPCRPGIPGRSARHLHERCALAELPDVRLAGPTAAPVAARQRAVACTAQDALDFARIDKAIATGALYAVAVTASGYVSGESICFVQGNESLEMWRRSQRASARVQLSVEHLLASSAIPFIFPANLVNREFFGDGSMRQTAPISPAIHLGADRFWSWVAASDRTSSERQVDHRYPSLAQVAGHAMASIFLDSLYTDLERLERINKTLQIIPMEIKKRSGLPLRPVEALVIEPSQRLDHLAAEHVHCLPWPVRWLLRGIGGTSQRGSALASYLLFERAYTRALMDLGYGDAMARRDEIARFLRIT